jgi:hypothetical protein
MIVGCRGSEHVMKRINPNISEGIRRLVVLLGHVYTWVVLLVGHVHTHVALPTGRVPIAD